MVLSVKSLSLCSYIVELFHARIFVFKCLHARVLARVNSSLSTIFHDAGTKLKDFLATMQSSAPIQSEIAKLRHDVEEYAKQFPTIGFEKETMKYKI